MLPDQIMQTAAALFGVTQADILSNSRVQRTAEARQAVMWGLRKAGWTVEAIGDYLHRDHTTVLYGLEMMDKKCATNADLAARLSVLTVGGVGILEAADLVAHYAKRWAAHDGALAYALRMYQEARKS